MSDLENAQYRTSDTNLAAFLVTQGGKVQSLEAENPQRVRFVISGLKNWERMRQAYFGAEIPVAPIQFMDERHKLLALLKAFQSEAASRRAVVA